jgi:hypothetical protein
MIVTIQPTEVSNTVWSKLEHMQTVTEAYPRGNVYKSNFQLATVGTTVQVDLKSIAGFPILYDDRMTKFVIASISGLATIDNRQYRYSANRGFPLLLAGEAVY